jgi:hypothetical protein
MKTLVKLKGDDIGYIDGYISGKDNSQYICVVLDTGRIVPVPLSGYIKIIGYINCNGERIIKKAV